MEKPSVREMIRRASQELGGLGVSPATRPGASPVKGTCPKGSSPLGARENGSAGPGWFRPCCGLARPPSRRSKGKVDEPPPQVER